MHCAMLLFSHKKLLFQLTLLYQSYNFPRSQPRNHRTGHHGQVDVQEYHGLQSGVYITYTYTCIRCVYHVCKPFSLVKMH